MIRIDEIYGNTFWPFIKDQVPNTKLYCCDPPGNTNPDSLINFGGNGLDMINYIFFHDQEPIHLDIYTDLFDEVYNRNPLDNISYVDAQRHHGIVTSEFSSDTVEELCKKYNWKSYYYFFHGWASLDWYRGYDKTFLITNPGKRKIAKTFIAPNRIIAGERKHRLEMLYHIFKNRMLDNHISCPDTCPVENISIHKAIEPLIGRYPDIESVFANTTLPIQFEGETDHPMHSCWLSLFNESAESLLYLVTETVYTGRRHHLTEKTFKPIALGMPFVVVGTRGSLEYLRSYGFRTFEGIWDESYDNAEDDTRIERIGSLLRSLDELPLDSKQDLFDQAQEVIEHNWNHFYNGGFEKILWVELQGMLTKIKKDFY